MNDKYIPTPQEIMNLALKDLSKALDAANQIQKLLLEKLQRSSPMPELDRYMRYGSRAPRRKSDSFGKEEIDVNIEN